MKQIYLIKDLDLFSSIYLYIFVLKRNSHLRYYNQPSKVVLKFLEFLSKISKINTYQFNEKNEGVNKSEIFYLAHFKTNNLVNKFVEKIIKKKIFTEFISKKIKLSKSKIFLEQLIASEIYEYVYLSSFVLKDKSKQNKYHICVDTKEINELIKLDNDFSLHKFKIIPKWKNFLFVRLLFFLLNITYQLVLSFFYSNAYRTHSDYKIAINYSFDLDSPLSNNWWLQNLKIKKKNIIYYFSEFGKIKATDKIISQIKDYGYSYKILKKELNCTTNVKSENLYLKTKTIFEIIRNLFNLIKNFKKTENFIWQMKKWLQLILKVNKYNTFIQKNNINVILDNTEMTTDIFALSSSVTGISKIYYQRSEIYFPISYFRPAHEYFFIWGELSSKILKNYNSNNYTNFIKVGNLLKSFPKQEEIHELVLNKNKNFFSNNDSIIISVFDRSSGVNSWIGKDYHKEFYDKIISIAERYEKVRLIIKPKNSIERNILEYNNIENRINLLVGKDRIIILSADSSVLHASLCSKISFSLGINSAGVQSSINGTYPFFWDPLLYSDSKYKELASFAGYEESFNISSNIDFLITNLESILSSNKKIEDLKLSSDFILKRNHFGDTNALKRITEEVEKIIE